MLFKHIEHYFIDGEPWFSVLGLQYLFDKTWVKNQVRRLPPQHKRTLTLPGLPRGNPKRAFVDRIGLCMIVFRQPNTEIHRFVLHDVIPRFTAYAVHEYRMSRFLEAAQDTPCLYPIQAYKLYRAYVDPYASLNDVRDELTTHWGYHPKRIEGVEVWEKR